MGFVFLLCNFGDSSRKQGFALLVRYSQMVEASL